MCFKHKKAKAGSIHQGSGEVKMYKSAGQVVSAESNKNHVVHRLVGPFGIELRPQCARCEPSSCKSTARYAMALNAQKESKV